MSLICRELALCHPKARTAFSDLNEYLRVAYQTGLTKTRFEVFETYRSPIRQRELLAKGASKAGPFKSAHQFGLAVDFVPVITDAEAIEIANRTGERTWGGWNWNASHDYRFLATAAKSFELSTPISWDLVHVEHPLWKKLSKEY